jgi:hypothetical protein
MSKYIPLTTGILVPISLFLNIQSISVPLVQNPTEKNFIFIFSILSILFGLIATISLFVRMLERKIKWMTRMVMIGCWSQGIIASMSLLLFHALHKQNYWTYTEAFVYRILASITSLIAGSLIAYQIHLNELHRQLYSWTLYQLSIDQRQFILLTIISILYMTIVSYIYTLLEGWGYEFALYWCIVSFTTIGFGDYSPKTVVGMVLVPPVTFVGIGLVGTNMWSLRNVFLEFLALNLASEYNKVFVENVVYELPIPTTDNSTYLIPQLGPKPIPSKRRTPIQDLFYQEAHSMPIHTHSNVLNRSSAPPEFATGDQHVDGDLLSETAPRHHSFSETTHRSILPGSTGTLPRTMTISRSSRLPSVTVVGNEALTVHHIEKTTLDTIKKHILISWCLVVMNIVFSGIVFSRLEGWAVWEGFYFAYCSFTTIGNCLLMKGMVIMLFIHIWEEVCSFGLFSLPSHHLRT